MMTATDLTHRLTAIAQSASTCEATFGAHFVWTPLTTEFEKELVWAGTTASKQNAHQYGYAEYPSPYDYWSPDFPVALAFYPYNDCQVYQHRQSGCYFFVYTEHGGHAPEQRCRLIRQSLIVPDLPPLSAG